VSGQDVPLSAGPWADVGEIKKGNKKKEKKKKRNREGNREGN
jgi:hypothetical protein